MKTLASPAKVVPRRESSGVNQRYLKIDLRPESMLTKRLQMVRQRRKREIAQLVSTTASDGTVYNNLVANDIYWWDNFRDNHIAGSDANARAQALARAQNQNYAGRFTFMSAADLRAAIVALAGNYGQGNHDVQLNNVPYRWVTILYGADNNIVNQSGAAQGNINISFFVTASGYIRVYHMQDT